ncbi:class I SAM-dependent methyltransferase [Lysinibacillus fusiformis]|uniref:class I SAM-dependent methyltransferase n=1 Tax=Lysinibacillus fusiformis TaxID=28031 RepID=UPI00215AA973|nr:class I SAM-dependent methyltransferase [Lysinibacillus fusiformis]MCR8851199.1 class I SAM-dependent methyltransferase [Lysinibacillus fusiformis]WKT77729.1 class I SAM-dependent methyltransferase [Lysinibacillus fusiformis]
MKKYIFWGAGNLGRKAYREHAEKVEFFIDMNKELYLEKIDGKDILSPDILNDIDIKNYSIVITSSSVSSVLKEIMKKGITEVYYYEIRTGIIKPVKIGIDFSNNLVVTESIEGFLTKQEQLCLMFLPGLVEGIIGDIVEIGSYMGKSICSIAGGAEAFSSDDESSIYCIDPFEGYMEREEYLEEFKSNVQYFYNQKEIQIVKGKSYEKHDEIKTKVKLLFIDGNHEYGNVIRDLRLFLPKVSIGGVIAMHDSDSKGVSQAINELINNKSYNKLFNVDSISVFRKLL